jgi:hypothetical protein
MTDLNSLVIFAKVVEASSFRKRRAASRCRSPLSAAALPTSRTSSASACSSVQRAIQAIGRSRGGRTTKIHAIVDGTCRPLAFCLSPGNVADIKVALLASTPLSRQFLADQAYDARAFRQRLAERGALVV